MEARSFTTATIRTVLGATLALALLPARVRADERVLTLRPDRTSVAFVLKATAHEVRGVVPLIAGEVRFDTTTGAAAGTVTLDARGTTTGNRWRDRDMHADVLQSERFPIVTFTPTRLDGTLAETGPSEVTVRGTVTLVGTQHPLVLPAKVRRVGAAVSAESTFDVPYVEWGLHDPSVLLLRVAKVIAVTVKLEGDLR